jgi:hypothetical protein
MSNSTTPTLSAVAAAILVWALPALAESPKNTAMVLQKGQVACVSRKDAQNYQSYLKVNQDFAADLLDRAACFKADKDMEAISLGLDKGFPRLKLLSGHTIWISKASQ